MKNNKGKEVKELDALKVSHVYKSFDKFQLEDINFHLPKGSIMGLIGENGAGKSTIINCILELVKKDQGDIEIFGTPIEERTLAQREELGVVLDIGDFYDAFDLEQCEKILRDLYKNWDSTAFEKYKEKFSLPDKKRIQEFSRGMKMKTSIAIALSHHPRILILDEATSGLDPIMRDEILDVFLDFVQDEQHAILISSHISSDLEKVADYITFIHDGKLILSSSKDELIYQYGIMKCRNDEFENIDQEDILRYRKDTYAIEILVKDREAAARKYSNCVVDPARLDDIMMLYVKGEQL